MGDEWGFSQSRALILGKELTCLQTHDSLLLLLYPVRLTLADDQLPVAPALIWQIPESAHFLTVGMKVDQLSGFFFLENLSLFRSCHWYLGAGEESPGSCSLVLLVISDVSLVRIGGRVDCRTSDLSAATAVITTSVSNESILPTPTKCNSLM